MAVFDPIKVTGLNELKAKLKAIDSGAGPALRKVLNKSADIIVDHTPEFVPKRSGRMAASIRARSTQNKARVTEGGPRVPYAGWLDFGGKRPKRGARPFRRHGRYIYVTLGRRHDDIRKVLQEGLVGLAKGAGLEMD